MNANENGFLKEIPDSENLVLKIRVDWRPFAVQTHRFPVVVP
jgi:hypothetical protein